MNKLKFILPVCICILFSGCGKEEVSNIPYSHDGGHTSDINISSITTKPEGDLFTNNICVIDSEHNDSNSDITAQASMIINNKK